MRMILAIVVIAGVIFYFFTQSNNQKAAKENIEKGKIFLADNAKREGVIQTLSGLQYEVLVNSEKTEEHPSAKSKVTVHYHGTLIDGTVFDSSVDRGETISFGLNQVIAGWTEGVQLMTIGDKFRFYVPSQLAYGNRSSGKIEGGSVLIFDVELFEIN
ncbi:FKBP-type peptidyl-prolyl cis-trans isomerase [Shewanella livingstonensis]|uniref:Peptidyl-prolyl cis-trans isomerase n=1 Tax=Shewanella livingstonensis TaxID=150120 RepID=A0A3G8LXG7_9GAMM|nr:FKBP-type peptidyl-prolyl cis-trans isomerase [Shewanella livingstonensis]AZG74369.1 FKBP-type peptidyl-prolyl cis-trans isomerase [Shewanella livingstonensis]